MSVCVPVTLLDREAQGQGQEDGLRALQLILCIVSSEAATEPGR